MTRVIVAILVFGFSTAHAGRGGGHSHSSRGMSGTGSSSSSHAVRGYTKSNGTTVAPHRQTNPNHTQVDNYSTKGNVNPSNGKVGTKPATH